MSNVSTIVSDMPPAIADLDHELLRRLVLLFRERRRHQRTAGPASVSVEAEALRKRSPPGRGTLTGKAEVLLQRIHEYSDLRKREDSWDYINSALLLANWALRYDSCTRVAAAFGVEYLDDEFAAAELLGEYGEVPPATWKAGYPLAQYSAIYSPEPVVARGEPRECDGPIWDPLCPPIESIGPIADELLKQPRCARIVCLDCGTASFAQELSTSCPAATIENFCRCVALN